MNFLLIAISKNIFYYIIQSMSFPRRRESHQKTDAALGDTRLRGYDSKVLRNCLILISIFLSLNIANAQEERSIIRNGNSKYENKQFSEAEIKYRKSLEIAPDSKEAKFNLGGSLYKQEKYENAVEDYQEMTSGDLPKKELASTFYNLGNSLLKSKKIEESIEAYKEAMKLNPEDADTKYNYSYARQMLKKQQEQQKQDKNKDDKNKDDKNKNDKNKNDKNKQDQNKSGDDKKDSEDQKKSDEKSDEQKNKQDQSKSGDDKKDDKKDEKQKQGADSKPLKISPKDAERMLQALAKQEKETQKKLRKLKKKSQNIEKNW